MEKQTEVPALPFLKADQLGKSYPSPAGPSWVLQDVSFEVAHGQSVSLTGPSGSGKSTLLNLLGLLMRPSVGDLLWEGQSLSQRSQGQIDQLRADSIGFVFQKHLLLPELNLLENVCLPLARRHGWGKDTLEKGREWLSKLGLIERQLARPNQLSGGEAQRGAIARALIHAPPLLLLDEPTGNLDPDMSLDLVMDIINLCKRLQITCIFVTHNLQLASLTERRMDLARHHIQEH